MGRLGLVDAAKVAAEKRSFVDAAVFENRETAWEAMLDRAARVAGGLRRLGVEPGDRVAVLSPNSDLYMLLYLAVPWAGAVIVPMNTRWSAGENSHVLDDCQPRIAFIGGPIDAASLAIFEARSEAITLVHLEGESRPERISLADLEDGEPIADTNRGDDDLLGVFYTGGTTGRPKGVMLSHASVIGNGVAMRSEGLCPDFCHMLIVAPLFHLAGVAGLVMTILAGGTAVILPAFEPTRAVEAVHDHGVTDALLVPTMIQMMLDAPTFDPARLRTLERVMYGASPMPEATLDRAMAAAPRTDFFQCYGMTELSPTAALLPPELHRGSHRAAGRHRGAGRPLGQTEIRVLDAQGAETPQGEVGEIVVRGPGVMLGYWNQPELTAETVVDGWMRTGDGGRFDDAGVLYVVDRMKDMIVTGGENVYSAEVESALSQHPAVALCAVIGVPDDRWGERVHAAVLVRPGVTVSAEDLIGHCRTLIAGYKCPRSIDLRTEPLPMSAAGKVLKTELRAPFWAGRTRNVA